MPVIISNTIVISTDFVDYQIGYSYLSNNYCNNILDMSYSLGPLVNGFYNAAVSIYDGNVNTIRYYSLGISGYNAANNISFGNSFIANTQQDLQYCWTLI